MKRASPEDFDRDNGGPLFPSVPTQQVAEARRERGMQLVADSVERRVVEWAAHVQAAIRSYATTHERFLAEDVRAVCATPDDIDGRAWGPLFKHAEALGVIEPDGYMLANSSNRSPKVAWKSRIFAGALH